jgi:hypothetical protein
MSNHKANNKKSTMTPVPNDKPRAEVGINKGYQIFPPDLVTKAAVREMNKVQTAFKSLRPVERWQLPSKSLYLPSRMLVRQKSDDSINCRLAIDGSRQPQDSYNEVDAGTSSVDKLLCLFSAVMADATCRGVELFLIGFDLAAAFLQEELLITDTNGYTFWTKLPSTMPGKLGTLWCQTE